MGPRNAALPDAAAAGGALRPYAVIYDGDCAVCGRIAARLRRWDVGGDLEIIAAQSPGVPERFPWIPQASYAESLQLVRVADGATWQGAASIEQLLRILPRGGWISWVFRIPLVRPLAEKLYRLFGRNRYRLGCGKHCPLA